MQIFSKNEIESLESYIGLGKKIDKDVHDYIRKAQKYTNILGRIPGIEMIALGNSLSMGVGTKESDIDLFVITKKESLWFVRVVLTIILQILGQRKTSKQHAGKFCLSFFCTEEALDLSNIAIEKDIYLFYRILNLKPLYAANNLYDRFIQSNTWANFEDFDDYFLNAKKYLEFEGVQEKKTFGLKWLDQLFKKFLLPRTMRQYKKLGNPRGVCISDSMLKFHDTDKREQIRDSILRNGAGKKERAL